MSRWLAPACLLLLAVPSPTVAQDNVTNNSATTAPPASVGPTQLKDFSLNGTVTREAEPTPAPAPAPTASTPTAAPASTRAAPARETTAPTTQTSNAAPADAAPAATAPTAIPSVAAPTISATPLPAPDLAARETASIWPWLLALLVAAGAIVFLWWRRQQVAEPAGPARFDLSPPAPTPTAPPRPRAAPPQPAPRAPAPEPAPAPAPPAPASPLVGGIVSRGLAPKLAFDFKPLWLELDGEGNAGLIYDLTIKNVGGAPARDVLVEAKMFNAGPDQDVEIGGFFKSPQGTGERVPMIPPQNHIAVRSRVALFAGRFQPIAVEGRSLLVPLVAFNSLYKGGGARETQSSGSFLIGVERPGEARMAPFRLDQGARRYDGLGARPHSGGIA